MAQPLGQILLKAGAINSKQLEEAIQAQVIFGGRLGTNLVELGHISLATLNRFLAKKFNVPTVDHTRIKPCSKEILKLLGKKLAVKHQVVPLALDGQRLDILMSNPDNFGAIDEIGFATGKRVKPYVTAELVIMALLEKYYGLQRDLRYVQLSIQDAKSMQHAKGATQGAVPSPTAEHLIAVKTSSPRQPEKIEIKGLDMKGGGELTTEAEFEEMLNQYHTPEQRKAAPPPPPPPPPPPQQAQAQPPAAERKPGGDEIMDLEELVLEAPAWEVDEHVTPPPPKGMVEDEEEEIEDLEILEELPEALSLKEAMAKLGEVKDRDELSQIVLAFALSYFKRAALFITRGGTALGWDGMGGTVNKRAVQGIMLPLNAPSIFKTVYDNSAFFLGAVPKTPLNDRFLKLMGDEKPASVFLIPILFQGQVVNILYGDNGNGENAPFDISDLLILAPKVPLAFEDLIMRKKRQTHTGG